MPKPYDMRLRRYIPGAGAGPILETLTIDWTAPRADIPTLRFEAAETVTGVLPDYTEIAVELWNGATWTEPRNGRFFILSRQGDDLDAAGTRSYTCVAAVAYLLSNALVVTADGTDLPSSANVGKTIGGVFTAAQGRGWGESLATSFTGTLDSAGRPWSGSGNALAGLTWKPGTSLKSLVQGLADQNALEYSLTGRVLDVFNPGTGDDLSTGTGRVTVGAGAKELPVTTTLEDLATHVIVRGDEGASWTFPVPGATNALGRLEKAVDASGVTTEAQAAAVAELTQVTGKGPRHQYTITEPAADMTARPFIEYTLGDWVSARRPNGWERMRVVQVQLRRDKTAAIEVDVILEDVMTDLATRIAKRTNGPRQAGSGGTPSPAYSGSGLGGGSGGKRGTLATPWGDEGAARVIFEGETEPDGNRYRYLDSYQPVSADPVLLSPFGSDGELVIMGRVRGLYIPNGGLYPGVFLSRSLDPRADYDGRRATDFLNVLPDDKGEAGSGLSLDYYGEATTLEAGTWDLEYQVTVDAYDYSPTIWGNWGRPWLALFLQVSRVTPDGGSMLTEYYAAPDDISGQNTAQNVSFTDSWGAGEIVLNIKDRRTFPAGYKFLPQLVANHTKPGVNVNQDASFMKITRAA